MRGQRQVEGRRLALRSRETRGVLIEKISNIQRQGTEKLYEGRPAFQHRGSKSVLYPSPLHHSHTFCGPRNRPAGDQSALGACIGNKNVYSTRNRGFENKNSCSTRKRDFGK